MVMIKLRFEKGEEFRTESDFCRIKGNARGENKKTEKFLSKKHVSLPKKTPFMIDKIRIIW